ncbi:hypothetical protein N7493_005069 [Penicillium malachiteum]|uniref:Uncharacterized protein n=1 Tax=Penicillium malachiteum TaxID=1324776 RepID=A0AAD6HMP0_9EURO|nr:hypothetical protein N7493_005069 [Penicillium malachiteum]
MPVLTLHLLAFEPSIDTQSFLYQLKQSPDINVIVASRPRHLVIQPSLLDKDPLSKIKWDLLVLLSKSTTSSSSELANADPIPSPLRRFIKTEYKITTGIPSKLLGSYPARDAVLKTSSGSMPLTGALEKLLRGSDAKSTSQNLEVSPELLDFMNQLLKTHTGPVTMLNLLHFHHPNGKKSYYQYGQAFVPVAGKRGGNAKLVGNVVPPGSGAGDSRGPRDRLESEWWNEISIVHYPSIRHFCDMLAGEDYQAINGKHRLSALKDTLLLCTTEFDVEDAGRLKL